VSNHFQFTGALLDNNTGLYKMGERYYDPSIGCFNQENSLGGGCGYAGSNPVNHVDNGGLSPTSPGQADRYHITPTFPNAQGDRQTVVKYTVRKGKRAIRNEFTYV